LWRRRRARRVSDEMVRRLEAFAAWHREDAVIRLLAGMLVWSPRSRAFFLKRKATPEALEEWRAEALRMRGAGLPGRGR
jgi:hypothetical protein